MNFTYTEIREFLRIKGDKISIKVLTAFGKDGDSYVIISPTLLVSGYGSNENEAKASFKHNLALFCKDFFELSLDQRNSYLLKLGFNKEKFSNKNFSKLYIDENGALQGLEQNIIKTSMLEAIV